MEPKKQANKLQEYIQLIGQESNQKSKKLGKKKMQSSKMQQSFHLRKQGNNQAIFSKPPIKESRCQAKEKLRISYK